MSKVYIHFKLLLFTSLFFVGCRAAQHSQLQEGSDIVPGDILFATGTIAYDFNTPSGPPRAVLFSETSMQRSLAAVVNRKDGNEVPPQGGVYVYFVAMEFHLQPDQQMVQVVFAGKKNKYTLPQLIPVQPLLAGEEIQLDLPPHSQNYYLASVSATGSLRFKLIENTSKLYLIEGRGSATVESVGTSPSTSNYSIKDLIGNYSTSVDLSKLKDLGR